MFLEPLSKCYRGFSYIFLITLYPTTFVTVDDPTLLQHRIFVFGGHQEVFDDFASSEKNLNPIVVTFLLHTLTQPLVVWYSYVGFQVGVLLSGIWIVLVSFGLVCSSSSSLCSMAIWGLYSSSVLLRDVLLLAVATVCWNIWSWLYDGIFQLHCSLRRLCDDCPNIVHGFSYHVYSDATNIAVNQ